MATYDNEQQEQLEQFKHFWKQYGNLITWVLVLVLGAYAAWTGYQYWQQKRGQAAAGLYEEMDRAVTGGNAYKAAQAFAEKGLCRHHLCRSRCFAGRQGGARSAKDRRGQSRSAMGCG